MSIIIQVTIYNDKTGEVEKQFIETYGSDFAHELARIFRRLGEKIIKLTCPDGEY